MPIIPNVAPVIFEEEITLEKFLYTRELVNEVSDKCKAAHLVRRSVDSILIVPFLIDSEKIAGKPGGVPGRIFTFHSTPLRSWFVNPGNCVNNSS